MRVLLTGPTGMLGRALVQDLGRIASLELTTISRTDADLLDPLQVNSVLARTKPDVVIHAAAKVGGIGANSRANFKFLDDNLRIDSNVIRSAVELGVGSFLYFGSSCMYPVSASRKLDESMLMSGMPEVTNIGYAMAKLTGWQLARNATENFGLNYKTLILSNLFGPGDNYDPSTGHLMASAIRKVKDAMTTGATHIPVWGSGRPRREYTYVRDVSSWIATSLQSSLDWPTEMNLGTGVDWSVSEIYQAVQTAFGVNLEMRFDTSKPDGVHQKLMDSSVAQKQFGWSPRTSLSQGLANAIKAYSNEGSR